VHSRAGTFQIGQLIGASIWPDRHLNGCPLKGSSRAAAAAAATETSAETSLVCSSKSIPTLARRRWLNGERASSVWVGRDGRYARPAPDLPHQRSAGCGQSAGAASRGRHSRLRPGASWQASGQSALCFRAPCLPPGVNLWRQVCLAKLSAARQARPDRLGRPAGANPWPSNLVAAAALIPAPDMWERKWARQTIIFIACSFSSPRLQFACSLTSAGAGCSCFVNCHRFHLASAASGSCRATLQARKSAAALLIPIIRGRRRLKQAIGRPPGCELSPRARP